MPTAPKSISAFSISYQFLSDYQQDILIAKIRLDLPHVAAHCSGGTGLWRLHWHWPLAGASYLGKCCRASQGCIFLAGFIQRDGWGQLGVATSNFGFQEVNAAQAFE